MLESTADLTFLGQESTLFRFKLDEKGNLMPGSLNCVHKPLRAQQATQGFKQ
ncbi:MAG TPA: hypothetical protein VLX09_05220 [Stellaceae bacterium]|nr:hypothetical protein [Stellaceae bacterium]